MKIEYKKKIQKGEKNLDKMILKKIIYKNSLLEKTKNAHI